MAGKRKELNSLQKVSIASVKEMAKRYRDLKSETEERVREQIRKENAQVEVDYSIAIRRARELGVPISTIGTLGMGTSDHGTVNRWLAKTARMDLLVVVGDSPIGAFSWTDKAGRIVKVAYQSFPTVITEDSYPAVLEGTVEPDSESRTGWKVLDDPGTIETDMGTLKGWFSFEVEDVATSDVGSLTSQLNQWVEANS